MIIPIENRDRLLSPEDYEGMDRLYRDRAVEAVRNSFPYERGGNRIEVFDVKPGDTKSLTPSDTRDAVIQRETLEVPITGRFRITDTATGNVTGETDRRTLMKVPRLTPDGEMIRRGIRYAPLKQMRLDPGVYVRNREDGSIEAAVTVAPGTGRNFNLVMDPETGQFNMHRAGRKVPLSYVLKNLGMEDEDIENVFGELAPANRDTKESGRLASWRSDVIKNQQKKHPEMAGNEEALFATAFTDIGLDPEVTKRTLGESHSTVDTRTIADAVDKMRKVRQGVHFGDSRDSLQFQRIYTFGDILKDRLERDMGGVMRNKLSKALRTGNPKDIPTAPLSDHVNSMFAGAAPLQAIEGISPVERQSSHYRLTRLGEGAISSIDAAPAEARNVQHSYFNYIDGVVSPESAAIGLDVSLARNTFLDPDSRRLFTVFERPSDGERVLVRSDKAPDMVLSTREDMDRPGDTVPAMVRQEGVKEVPKEQVDLVVPSGDELYSPAGNRTYATGGIKSMRANMGARYPDQAVPVTGREAPLVDKEVLGPDGEVTTMSEETGRKVLGALRAGRGGKVTEVSPGRIKITDDDGKEHIYGLHDRDPLPRKTFFHQTPKVREGQRVGPGELLATSNFTDDEGKAATGTNLRVAWTPYEGLNFDDAVVISESAAEKLGHEAMYRMRDTFDSGETAYDKNKFKVLFPSRYSGDQMDKLDDRGVIREGSEVSRGDPLALAVTRKDTGLSAGRKQTNMDSSIIWDHEHDGRVEYVAGNPEDGYEIYVSSFSPMEEGDKIGQFFGGKGVVSRIVKDSEMLTDEKGRPVDLILNPYSIISRLNPAQVSLGLLGKVADQTGEGYRVRGFSDEDLMERAAKELEKQGMSATETLHNPVTGKDRKDTLTGNLYTYKLGHLAEQKGKARSTGFYTSEGQPGRGGPEGGKHIGQAEWTAMLSHGAPDTIRDMKIRGQRSDDLWRSVRTGGTPVMSGTPLVYEKYRDLMKAAGVNFTEKESSDEISAMTGGEMENLTGRSRVRSPLTFREKDGEPIPGGLMDPDIFGPRGDQWAGYKSPEPVYHPMMEPVAARLLDVPITRFRKVMSGEDSLEGGLTGPEGVREALSEINLDNSYRKALEQFSKGSGQAKHDAVKKLRYIEAMRDKGVKPEDYFTENIPVLPPRFRPISKVNDMVVAADMNRLYRELMDAGKDLEDSEGLPDSARQDARRRYQNAYRAVIGTMEPEPSKLKDTRTQGLLSQLFGKGSGKHGFTQRRVIGTNIDMSGLAVAAPEPSLRLDQIGLPEPRVWKLYEPLIVSEMVRGGWPAVRAAQAVADRDKRARPYLDKAVKDRPVIVNRAPTLHKYGVMAFWPKITKGNVIRVPPAIGAPYNLDYDGDSVLNTVKISFDLGKLDEIEKNFRIDNLQSTFPALYYNFNGKISEESETLNAGDGIMINENTKVASLDLDIPIEDIPRIDSTGEVKSDNVTEYDVPEGVYIYAYDKNTGHHGHHPVTKFSVHNNVSMREVTVGGRNTYGEVLTVSSDHSLVVYDPDTGNVVEDIPDNCQGKVVPSIKDTFTDRKEQIAKYIRIGNQVSASRETGFFIGAMLGDGWVSSVNQVHMSCEYPLLRDYLMTYVNRHLPQTKDSVNYEYNISRLGPNITNRINFHLSVSAARDLKDLIGSGCRNKRIPAVCLKGSRAHLKGILEGLLSTDGQITYNIVKGKSTSNKAVRYDTVSPYLRDTLQTLCRKLGIRSYVHTYTGSFSGESCYAVFLCLTDFMDFADKEEFRLYHPAKQGNLEKVLSDLRDNYGDGQPVKTDTVPFPAYLKNVFRWLRPGTSIPSSEVVRYRKQGLMARARAEEFIRAADQADWKDYSETGVPAADRSGMSPDQVEGEYNKWRKIVEDRNVYWKRIESVQDGGTLTCYDITVPGPYTFALSSGVIVQDTMSYSVPVTERGRKDAVRKMMPQQNLMSAGDFGPHYIPSQEYAGGLYFASRPPEGKAKRKFSSREEALDAYRKGEIRIDDPVVIDDDRERAN